MIIVTCKRYCKIFKDSKRHLAETMVLNTIGSIMWEGTIKDLTELAECLENNAFD